MSDQIRQAAQAVLDRWDSPKWEWQSHGPTADLMADLRKALAASPQPTAAQPVAWVYWNPSDTTFDGPDTNHKKAVSFFTDDTRQEMARKGWQFEPLVYASAAPALAADEIERLKDELQLCCELKRQYQEQAAPVAELVEALPPLPEPYCYEFRDPKERFTADQMRAYATKQMRAYATKQVDAERDDEHGNASMSIAAACYALADVRAALAVQTVHLSDLWSWTGWSASWFKPKDRRSNLIRAAALLVAEIERLDRHEPPNQ